MPSCGGKWNFGVEGNPLAHSQPWDRKIDLGAPVISPRPNVPVKVYNRERGEVPMDFLELAQRRYSCRNYRPEPVPRQKIDYCLQATRLAPSSGNSQSWHFLVVDEAEKVEIVANCLTDVANGINQFAAQAAAFVLLLEGAENLTSRVGGLCKNYEFTQTNLGIAVAYLCLAATDCGLGSCILGWFNERKLKKTLSIPTTKRVRMVVALGYPLTQEIPSKERKPLEELVDYNCYFKPASARREKIRKK